MVEKGSGNDFPHDNKRQYPGKPHKDLTAYFTDFIYCFNKRTHLCPLACVERFSWKMEYRMPAGTIKIRLARAQHAPAFVSYFGRCKKGGNFFASSSPLFSISYSPFPSCTISSF
jgi:hypothetical protein